MDFERYISSLSNVELLRAYYATHELQYNKLPYGALKTIEIEMGRRSGEYERCIVQYTE